MRPRSTVLAILPNAGLANKLFVWAKAQLFAHLNGLPVNCVGWSYPKPLSIVRGEGNARAYARFFERGSWPSALFSWTTARSRGNFQVEPACSLLDPALQSCVFLFSDVPHWKDYFADIREHREFIQQRFFEALRPRYREDYRHQLHPIIALHIRRGDFRELRPNEDFRHVGGVRTADDYFVGILRNIRAASGYDTPAMVFSDGSDKELDVILRQPNVTRSVNRDAVADMIQMSKARIIVTSAGSTFSEWAGYLSDAAIIRHPDHIHAPIRSAEARQSDFEGPPPQSGAGWSELWSRHVLPKLGQ